MSFSTFQCMSFCFTTIYSHQNSSSQLQTLTPFRKKLKTQTTKHHESSKKTKQDLSKTKTILLWSQFQKTFHFQTLKKLLLAKASASFPYPRKPTNSLPDKMSKNFLAAFSLKHFFFFHNKEDKSDNTGKDAFETLTARKSKWTPPKGQFASTDYFI